MIIKGLIILGSVTTLAMLAIPTGGELGPTQQILLYFAGAVILGLVTAVATLFKILVVVFKKYQSNSKIMKDDFDTIKVLLKNLDRYK